MKHSAISLLLGLLFGAALGWYAWGRNEPAPDHVAGIVLSTPEGRLAVVKNSRVEARAGQRLRFDVVNSSWSARLVTFSFDVAPCRDPIQPVTVPPQAQAAVDCVIRPDLVTGDQPRREIRYTIAVDNQTVDPVLVVYR